MNNILSYLESNYMPIEYDRIINNKGMVKIVSNNLIGLCLKDELLLISSRGPYYSSRIRYENLNNLDVKLIYRYRETESIVYLEEYFKANKDNPYAVFHIMNFLLRGVSIQESAQFPPLIVNKDLTAHNKRLSLLIEKAKFGDVLYTYQKDSGVSNLIRQLDYSMWSHVALVVENNVLSEMTINGKREDRMLTGFYDQPNFYLALFRPKLNEIEKNRYFTRIQKLRNQNIPYALLPLVKAFINHKLRIKIFKKVATIRGYHEVFPLELIEYV